ncbi:hypothetical protein JZO73_10010 [Enterococcus plantarum]|uniref:hypothetical protein n=1 Tax=Enterococcus plantarum TaxID=1077675 RepID=UPI001A8C67C9|nr:hypothetical protein [Enterococcus plantarum]MBO0467864.1 hypothetical protein [Enterococcus plantarum]
MKKIVISVLTLTALLGLSACGSTEKTPKKKTAVSTEDSSTKKDKQMKQMEEDLEEKGVEININSIDDSLYFIREKGIDYDYFDMTFDVLHDPDEIRNIMLRLKGNISGKDKDTLYYEVSKGRIVESSVDNTSINDMAKVLKSLDYSDKEILEFAQWYYNKNQ